MLQHENQNINLRRKTINKVILSYYSVIFSQL